MLARHAREQADPIQVIAPSTTNQRRIFVLMPFAPAWSPTVYEMIKRTVLSLPISPSPAVLRADDITDAGRITDQIVAEIAAASVIIADIIDLNPT
jgi:hypothetical protein